MFQTGTSTRAVEVCLLRKFVLGELTFATDSSHVAAKSGEGSIPVRHHTHHACNDAGRSVDYRLQCSEREHRISPGGWFSDETSALRVPLPRVCAPPILAGGLSTGFALQKPKATFNRLTRDRLEQNPFGRSLHDGLRAILDVELLAQPARNHQLAFGSEPNGSSFRCCAHKGKFD